MTDGGDVNQAHQQTLVIFKPDAVQRGIMHVLLKQWEQRGFVVRHMRSRLASRQDAERHYSQYMGQQFYDGWVTKLSSGTAMFLVVEGEDIIRRSREIVIDLQKKYAMSVVENTVHASASIVEARREIAIWFPEGA